MNCQNPLCRSGNVHLTPRSYRNCLDSTAQPSQIPQKGVQEAQEAIYSAPWHSALIKALGPVLDGSEPKRTQRVLAADNARARAKGFPTYEALLASGWTPVSERHANARLKRARHRVAQNDKGAGIWCPREENPFLVEHPPTPFNWI